VLPDAFPSVQIAATQPFGLTSFALSLLLAYRTNASYERWDGARKMWGLMLNRSRDFVRQVRAAAAFCSVVLCLVLKCARAHTPPPLIQHNTQTPHTTKSQSQHHHNTTKSPFPPPPKNQNQNRA
jgi:predicted membrane chloride channel (bestrophin family)